MKKTKVRYRIKMLHRGSIPGRDLDYVKQTPNSSGMWGSCRFIFDPFERDYDWLVVVDDLPKILPGRQEQLACPKEHTVLVTSEPSSITFYGEAFAKQFAYLITNQDEHALPHANALRSQTGNYWFYGKTFDEIIAMKPPQKLKPLSTICSNKRQGHTMHRLRYDFTARMEKEIPELERFGRGFKWIETKAEAIDPYRFHVAVENHIAPHVWTEKLADAFLGYAVPIYHGCPNVFDYFPEESVIPIDITKPEEALETIRRVISTPGEYERRLEAVIEARRRVIEIYNLPAMIARIVEMHDDLQKSEGGILYNRRAMRVRYMPDLVRFLGWKSKNTVKNLWQKVRS